MNPFDLRDIRREIEWYEISSYCPGNGLNIATTRLAGRCDELLNVAMFIPSDELDVPRLIIDNTIWMSLTPMEIQAAWVPIQLAAGNVATGGLGMGYYALRVAEKDDVERLDVYERDERVISMFNTLFAERPGFDKINIIVGDVRDTFVDKSYDYVFMDIYPTLLADEVFDDMTLFFGNNDDIGSYRFFGEEVILIPLLEEALESNNAFTRLIVPYTEHDERFLAMWKSTVRDERDHVYMPYNLRPPIVVTPELTKQYLEAG